MRCIKVSQNINNYIVNEENGIYLPKEEREHLGVISGDELEVVRVPDGSLILRKSNEGFRTNNIEQLREDNETRQRLEDIERRQARKDDEMIQITANKDLKQ